MEWWDEEMPVCPCGETADCGAHGFNKNAEDRKAQVHWRGLIATMFRGLSPDRRL